MRESESGRRRAGSGAGTPRLRAPPNRADLGDGLGGHGDDAAGGTDADGAGGPGDERAAPGLTGGAGDRDRRVAVLRLIICYSCRRAAESVHDELEAFHSHGDDGG